MLGAAATSSTLWLSPSFHSSNCNFVPRIGLPRKCSNSRMLLSHTHYSSSLSTSPLHFSFYKSSRRQTHFYAEAASSSSTAASAEYVEEPATKVKFQTSLSLPGCSDSLILFGAGNSESFMVALPKSKPSVRTTLQSEMVVSFNNYRKIGYREKVFAIIGVKVYAAGLYLNKSITSELSAWQGQPADVIQGNSSLFKTIFQSPFEKSLQIILVRDVDGKTFWDALDDAISPRIKTPTTEDETALSTFQCVFQDRPLKKGNFIFLTWLNPPKLLVSVSSHGFPSTVDAKIESANVTSALFDVFLGDSPVSPTLKASVANGLSKVLK